MSEYTSTREGYERAMKISLTGPPEEARAYAEATSVPTFYHIMNGKRIEYPEYVKLIEEWRSKSADYNPKIEEFLRDGDQLAARMTGTMKIDGVESHFESFMFAKLEKGTGKMISLTERSVWGRVGEEYEHGVN